MPIHFNEITSTQIYAKEFVNSHSLDTQSIYIITANTQTNGYGMRGTEWHSLNGNVFATYIIPNQFCASLSILQMIQCMTVSVCHELESHNIKNIQIKWCNDIMLHNKKIAGIIAEKITKDNNVYWIIGVGINLSSAPNLEHVDYIARLHPQHTVHNTTIATKILKRILYIFKNTNYILDLNTEYNKRLAYIGSVVQFNNVHQSITGCFVGIDSSGNPIISVNNFIYSLGRGYRIGYL